MMSRLKSKIQKFLLRLSGSFKHLQEGVSVPKKWYGNEYGGFFACPTLLNDKSIVYSFGIGEDISFDESIVRTHHCSVYGFDPTPKSVKWIRGQEQTLPPKFHFFEYGIGNKSGAVEFFLPKNTDHVSGSFISQDNVDAKQSIEVQLKCIVDIVEELGHQQIDVLKMDIEGAEYQVLESILRSAIPINQILVEFHDRFFEEGSEQTIRMINKLKYHHFEIFGISDSFEEVSFINKRVLPAALNPNAYLVQCVLCVLK
jgi:FkbM family methyltransferase